MGKKIVLAIFCGIIGFGVILALAGAAMGGAAGNFRYEDSRLVYREGERQVTLAEAPGWMARLVSRAATGRWSAPTSPEAPAAPAPFSSGELKKLDIDVGAGYVVVQPGDEPGLAVNGPMSYTSDFSDGTWTFTAAPPDSISTRHGHGHTRFWCGGEDITTTFIFTVPSHFDILSLDIDMGEADVTGLNLQSLTCITDMGAIEVSDVTAGAAGFTVAMGGVNATGLVAGSCELQCEMGGIDMEGRVTGLFTARCEMGSISAYLERPDDYGWTASADFGSASIDGQTASGLNSHTSGGNASAPARFDLDCGMGRIEIEFT